MNWSNYSRTRRRPRSLYREGCLVWLAPGLLVVGIAPSMEFAAAAADSTLLLPPTMRFYLLWL